MHATSEPNRTRAHSSFPRRETQPPPFCTLTGHIIIFVSSQRHVQEGLACLSGAGRRGGPISRENGRALLELCVKVCERVRYVIQQFLISCAAVCKRLGLRAHLGAHWRPPWQGFQSRPPKGHPPSHSRQKPPMPSKNTTQQKPRDALTQRTKRAAERRTGRDARRGQSYGSARETPFSPGKLDFA